MADDKKQNGIVWDDEKPVAGGSDITWDKPVVPAQAGPSQAENKIQENVSNQPGFFRSAANELGGQVKGLLTGKNSYEPFLSMGLSSPIAPIRSALDAVQDWKRRSAAGYSTPYKLLTAATEMAGIPTGAPGMEESAKHGNVRGVLGHAAVPMLEVAAPEAVHQLPPMEDPRVMFGRRVLEPPTHAYMDENGNITGYHKGWEDSDKVNMGKNTGDTVVSDYGTQPTLRPGAKVAAQAVGAVAGGAGGGLLGSYLGPMGLPAGMIGGAIQGAELAPSFLKNILAKEPESVLRARETQNALRTAEGAVSKAKKSKLAATPHMPTESIMAPGEEVPVKSPSKFLFPPMAGELGPGEAVTVHEPSEEGTVTTHQGMPLGGPKTPTRPVNIPAGGPRFPAQGGPSPATTAPLIGEPPNSTPTEPLIGERPPSTPENPLWSKAGKEAKEEGGVGGAKHQEELEKGIIRRSGYIFGDRMKSELGDNPDFHEQFRKAMTASALEDLLKESGEDMKGKKVSNRKGDNNISFEDAANKLLDKGYTAKRMMRRD